MSLSLPAKKLMMLTLIFTIVFIVAGIAFCLLHNSLSNNDILPVTLGIVLSTVISVIKILLLEHQVSKISAMEDSNKARLYGIGQGLLRFALTGAGLVAAHYIPFTNLIAAIAGAFIYNIAVYSLKFVNLDDGSNV